MPVPVQIFYGSLPEVPANAFLRRRDATHLYIQVQFMRSERLSRLLSLHLTSANNLAHVRPFDI